MSERSVPHGSGRDVLIAAAIAVVAESGLRGLTFRAVSQRADLSNSLISHHFGSREALLEAAVGWAVANSIATTELFAFVAGQITAEEFLASLATSGDVLAFQSEMIVEARRNPVFRTPILDLYKSYQQVTEAALRARGLQDVADAGRWVFASLNGIVMQRMAGIDDDRLRGALEDLQIELLARAERPASRS
ncbi:TetR family transcriptional regulator [Microbacterium sp. NPDC077184]|uniref:TetR/AcrR family transcriptional regulator n=1 Tax=Microbacterium sp. NPDC077184 TaxID=3154764 RepID=UPI0034391A52